MSDYIQRLRERIGTMRVVIPGVRALVVRESGEILLVRRGDFGSWALPGGVVDAGESVSDALHREVHEETGLRVRAAEPFGIYTAPHNCVVYPNGDEVQPFTLAFRVTDWAGELRPDGHETVEARFFPPDALPRPLYPVHVETLEDYCRGSSAFVVR